MFYDGGFTNYWSIAAKDGGQCDMPGQNDCDPGTTHCVNAAAPTYYTCNCSNGYQHIRTVTNRCESKCLYFILNAKGQPNTCVMLFQNNMLYFI